MNVAQNTSNLVNNLKKLSIQSTNTPKSISDWVSGIQVPNKAFLWGFGVVFFILLVVGITIILKNKSTMATPDNVKRISGTQAQIYETQLAPYQKIKTTMTSLTKDPLERCLVNYAPFTVMNAGYLGPIIDGVYSEEAAITGALKAGARCFVLPIDYHDDDTLQPPLYARKGEPCLLMRDAGGAIRSLNSGSIQRVAQSLSNVGFNDILSNKNDPLIIVLYFVRTPTHNTKEYLRYMSSVAKQLSPLIPYIIGQTPEGVYNRQAQQNELLYTNISNFERKVLIFCNADTSLFRNTKTVGLPAFTPREDLDYLVHLRLFKQSDTEFGVTQLADDKIFPRGYVENVNYYTILPDKQKQPTIDSNKIRWVMALSPPGTNPTSASTKTMVNQLGVQCVPLSLFTEFNDDMKETVGLWTKDSWRFKPQPIRFRKPEPFKPQAPSPQLNAQQGKITSPTL